MHSMTLSTSIFLATVGVIASASSAAAQLRPIEHREYEGAPAEGYVPTPSGWAHESCVFQVPGGAHVERSSGGDFTVVGPDGAHASLPRCGRDAIAPLRHTLAAAASRPTVYSTNGWAVASAATAEVGNYFKELHGTATVPASPTRPGGLLYFPSGLESRDGTVFLQTTLQYGRSDSADATGEYWTATSWLVVQHDDGTVTQLHANDTRVQPGDAITGHVTANDCTADGKCSWKAWLEGPNGSFGNIAVKSDRPMELAIRGAALFYKVDWCDQLPTSRSITFSDTRLIDARDRERSEDIKWSRAVWASTLDCGNGVENLPDGARLSF